MQNGSKYVPPHLRNRAAGGENTEPTSSLSLRAGYGSRGGGYSNRGSSRDTESAPPRQTNSRWNNVDLDRDGQTSAGGRGGGRSYSSGYGGRSYGGPRVNERGFHGDMRENRRLEDELFRSGDQQTTGINFEKYDKIPVETSGDDVPEPIDEYSIETVGEDLKRNVDLCGYIKPTPVQKYSIPIGTAGRDMMACAQTGSGKTAGFLFPIVMTMIRQGGNTELPDTGSRRKSFPQGLVLAPTRELASQIYEESRKFTYMTGISTVVVYGGADIRDQLRNLDQRGCDLLIATPGRLVDLIERGRISLINIRFLVLDEADRMLDMGFEPQIRRIVESEGMPTERQTMMFSATFPMNMQRLASDFLHDYIFVTIGRVGSASKDVKQIVEYMENSQKLEALMEFLLTIEEGLILVFVETKRAADYLEDMLCAKGFPACSIHGDKDQREREGSLKSFRRGDTPVMVATDVASRGLDIPNVTQVVNYDLPNNIDDYVHRIGRTGRAGNTGTALSFVNENNSPIIKDLYNLLVENSQEAPSWLKSMIQYASGGRGGRGGYRGRGGGGGGGGGSFGGRDYRTQERGDKFNSGSGGGGGGRRGGGGAYGSSYGGGGGGGGFGGGGYNRGGSGGGSFGGDW